jgi:hypothetical protein
VQMPRAYGIIYKERNDMAIGHKGKE